MALQDVAERRASQAEKLCADLEKQLVHLYAYSQPLNRNQLSQCTVNLSLSTCQPLALYLSASQSQGIDRCPPQGILLRATRRRTENISLSQDAAAKASALMLANSLSRNQQQENDKLAARCADLSELSHS